MLTSHIKVPRPYVDTISSLIELLSVASLAISHPVQNSTIVVWLSALRTGLGISVYEPVTPQVVHDIVGHASVVTEVSSVVLVSTRTTSPTQALDRNMLRFMNTVFHNSGVELLDWAVIGRGGLYCPRSLVNEPDPWPYSALNL